jgi:carboxylate-amine ligase
MSGKFPTRPLTMGLEEEFFVVEADTGTLIHDGWHHIQNGAARDVNLTAELYRAMIEARTGVHSSVRALLDEQETNRRSLVTGLGLKGRSLLGCGTHPLDSWSMIQLEDKDRYRQLVTGYGLSIKRALTCGMHIHFGFDSPALLIAAYNNMRPYLPFIAAASSASPFWQGRDTRVKSYRRAVFDAMPRSGLPPRISSFSGYAAFCKALEDPRYFSNGTTIWWDSRLNLNHCTLEIRVPDTVPDLRKAQAIVIFSALCIESALSTAPLAMDDLLIQENRWRATKFGLDATMFCGTEMKQNRASDCIDKIITSAESSPVLAEAGWTPDELRSRLLDFEDDHLSRGVDENVAARCFLNRAMILTAACAGAEHAGTSLTTQMSLVS